MFPKLSSSIGTALMLCAGMALASPNAPAAEFSAHIPDSIDYPGRMHGSRSPSNEEVDIAESGNPDSVRYGDRFRVPVAPISQAEWLALESENPDFR